jgi:hypothetical protein
MGFLAFSGDHFGLGALGIAASGVCWAAFTTAFATLTAAFTAALTALAAAFTSGCTLVAHFGAIGAQLWLCITAAFGAVLATTLAAAFARRTIARRALSTFTSLSTLAACGTCFAFAQFVTTFSTSFATAFTTTTTFAGCADFAGRAFAAFATAAVASTTATITALAIAAAFTSLGAALAAATFACFFIFLANSCWRCFSGTATEQVFQPAKETT